MLLLKSSFWKHDVSFILVCLNVYFIQSNINKGLAGVHHIQFDVNFISLTSLHTCRTLDLSQGKRQNPYEYITINVIHEYIWFTSCEFVVLYQPQDQPRPLLQSRFHSVHLSDNLWLHSSVTFDGISDCCRELFFSVFCFRWPWPSRCFTALFVSSLQCGTTVSMRGSCDHREVGRGFKSSRSFKQSYKSNRDGSGCSVSPELIFCFDSHNKALVEFFSPVQKECTWFMSLLGSDVCFDR